MPEYIDLHIHSDHSDGLQTPQNVVDDGVRLGLKAVSITDHDAVTGYVEAAAYASGKDIRVISGIELSAARTDDDIHILGYFFDPANARLLETLERFRRIRYERGKKMVKRLARIGVIIDYDEVVELAGQAAVGRPHLAEALFRHKHIGSYNEAFRKYLGLKGPVYVPKAKLTPAEAIEMLHDAGGVAVMAHPGLTNEDDMIEDMVAAGLDGIEIFHPTHKASARKRYRRMAERLGLFCTGGSDSHNRKGRYGDIGDEKVPEDYLLSMETAWRRRTGR